MTSFGSGEGDGTALIGNVVYFVGVVDCSCDGDGSVGGGVATAVRGDGDCWRGGI